MKVKALQDFSVSGLPFFEKEKEYSISDSLAETLIKRGLVEALSNNKPEKEEPMPELEPEEDKAVKPKSQRREKSLKNN